MSCKSSHSPPADQSPDSPWAAAALEKLSQVFLLSTKLDGMEQPFSQLSCPSCIPSEPLAYPQPSCQGCRMVTNSKGLNTVQELISNSYHLHCSDHRPKMQLLRGFMESADAEQEEWPARQNPKASMTEGGKIETCSPLIQPSSVFIALCWTTQSQLILSSYQLPSCPTTPYPKTQLLFPFLAIFSCPALYEQSFSSSLYIHKIPPCRYPNTCLGIWSTSVTRKTLSLLDVDELKD